MIQYKEKKKEQETGNLTLLSYPVLMAADIFLYTEQKEDLVIVGQDQKQHLELATDLANKFNNFYEKEELKNTNYQQFKIKLSHLLNEKLAIVQKKYNDYRFHIKGIIEKNNTYLKDLAERKIEIIKKELRILI